MIYIRPKNQRGYADHQWLKSWHSFSFADYYDAQFMGFSVLRVINEDIIKSGHGFGRHPHKDMEILTYVLQGTVEHKDSMGNVGQIHAGEFQIMSAGTGVYHSEYSVDPENDAHLYQIWLLPETAGITPRYKQHRFDEKGGKQLILSPNEAENSLKIYQDMTLWRWSLTAGQQENYIINNNRKIWIQVVNGTVSINGQVATSSDGVAVLHEELLTIIGQENSEILLFDMPDN